MVFSIYYYYLLVSDFTDDDLHDGFSILVNELFYALLWDVTLERVEKLNL
jgi:hypothetical protein